MSEIQTAASAAEEAYYRALCKRAGIADTDVINDPEHGLMVRAHAAHKLRALAPPSYENQWIGQMITDAARSAIKVVK